MKEFPIVSPVIVDLLPENIVQNHPDGIPVIGKFKGDTGSISMLLAEVRAQAIVQGITDMGIDRPLPLTFYISPNWQCFCIVAAVCAYFKLTEPNVVMIDYRLIDMPVSSFFNGDMFTRHPVNRKVVMLNSVVSIKDKVLPSFVPNQNQSDNS